jgi:hypothetical protein
MPIASSQNPQRKSALHLPRGETGRGENLKLLARLKELIAIEDILNFSL